MTVGELREALSGLEDGLEVVAHQGEDVLAVLACRYSSAATWCRGVVVQIEEAECYDCAHMIEENEILQSSNNKLREEVAELDDKLEKIRAIA